MQPLGSGLRSSDYRGPIPQPPPLHSYLLNVYKTVSNRLRIPTSFLAPQTPVSAPTCEAELKKLSNSRHQNGLNAIHKNKDCFLALEGG